MATEQTFSKRVCIGGGAGFIGSHLAKRLKAEGAYVVCADWKRNEFMKEEEFCNKFVLCDLREKKNCMEVTKDCDEVYNLAADMGGMGFIQSNHSVILYNNTMISFNMLEAARLNGVKLFFFSSSACVYPEHLQTEAKIINLKEEDAWPSQPQDAYGIEKIVTEELAMHYEKDFGMKCRIARFHNVYGPYGTWKGGREKAPAAFCRKAAVCKMLGMDYVERWGDGKATRSFMLVDDCVEGIIRLCKSDWCKPINLGSDECVTITQLLELACSFTGRTDITLKEVPGPEGVRGRNSDNTLIKKVLGWAPSIKLADGLKRTYDWIEGELNKLTEEEKKEMVSSIVVNQEDALKKNAETAAAAAAGN